jgi:DeoR/GlpR family transcriptional regulator of sugar metabolism
MMHIGQTAERRNNKMIAYFKHDTISQPMPDFCWLEFQGFESDDVNTFDVYEVMYDDTEITQKQIVAIEDALDRDPNCVQFVH